MSNNYVYTISGIGKCAKALWAYRNNVKGEPVPEWVKSSAEEGTMQEAVVKNKLRKMGWTIEEAEVCKKCNNERKGMHVELDCGDIHMIGHMDGRAQRVDDTSKRVLEVKTMSQFEFDRWMKGKFEAFPVYAAQLTTYMQADKTDKALYAVKNRNNGYLDILVLNEPPMKFTDVIKNVELSTHKEIPDIEADFTTLECRRCAFKKALCIKTKDQMVVQNEAELDEACKLYREGSVELESGEAKIKQAKAILLEHTIAVKMKKYIYNNLAISLVERGYKGYNAKKLEELFTEKQLKPALVEKPINAYITIVDLNKDKE
jgi:hypothetical protein